MHRLTAMRSQRRRRRRRLQMWTTNTVCRVATLHSHYSQMLQSIVYILRGCRSERISIELKNARWVFACSCWWAVCPFGRSSGWFACWLHCFNQNNNKWLRMNKISHHIYDVIPFYLIEFQNTPSFSISFPNEWHSYMIWSVSTQFEPMNLAMITTDACGSHLASDSAVQAEAHKCIYVTRLIYLYSTWKHQYIDFMVIVLTKKPYNYSFSFMLSRWEYY